MKKIITKISAIDNTKKDRNGKPYLRIQLEEDNSWHSVFREGHKVDAIQSLNNNTKVEVTLEQNGNYINILDISPIIEEELVVNPIEPEKEFKPIENKPLFRRHEDKDYNMWLSTRLSYAKDIYCEAMKQNNNTYSIDHCVKLILHAEELLKERSL